MALFQALLLVPVAILSPGLALLFALAISGRWLLSDPKRQKLFVPAFCLGILIVWLGRVWIPGTPDNLQMALAFVGGGVSTAVFLWVFGRTWRVSLGLVTTTYLNAFHSFMVTVWWKPDYKVYTATMSKAFESTYNQAMATSSASPQVSADRLHDMIIYVLNHLQPAMWTLGITLSAYVGALLLIRGMPVRWRLDHIRLPFHVAYPLLIGMAMLLYSPTREYGANVLLMLSGLFLIQGISVLHFFWKNWLKGSMFMTVILIVTLLLNPFFILLIAFCGLIDVWLNLRKLANEEELDESDPGERYA